MKVKVQESVWKKGKKSFVVIPSSVVKLLRIKKGDELSVFVFKDSIIFSRGEKPQIIETLLEKKSNKSSEQSEEKINELSKAVLILDDLFVYLIKNSPEAKRVLREYMKENKEKLEFVQKIVQELRGKK